MEPSVTIPKRYSVSGLPSVNMQLELSMFRKKLTGILIAVVALVALLLSLKVYIIRTDSRGALLWNADNAYFFIGMADRGYRFSYLRYLAEELRESLPFGASSPSDNHFSALVLHVTPDSVQRYSTDNFWLGSDPDPFQGELYAGNMLPSGGFMKWSGTHFEPATPEEAEKFHEYAISLPKGPPAGPNYDNVEGWSKRTLAGEIVSESPTNPVEKDSKVMIEVDGNQVTFVMNSGYVSQEAYIDLIRPGQPPERIWHLDEHPHRVSRAEYYKIFGNRAVANKPPKP
jgi:hypothetical protein